MNIPNFNDTRVADKDGYLTDEWRQIFAQLFSQLQGGISDEGISVPQQNSANITTLADANKAGTLLYDSDNHNLKANINGNFQSVLTHEGNSTGTQTVSLGSNSPATAGDPHTWVKVKADDGTVCYMPAWK